MKWKRPLIVVGCLIAVGAAAGVLTWHFWPEPPPTTATQVVGAVMVEKNPLEMTPKQLDEWVNAVADVVERLPAHETQKLLQVAMQDEAIRERFESLKPETRRRLFNLISEEQRARMMASMAQGMVAMFKAMPKSVRNAALRQMHARRKQGEARRAREGKGGHPPMTKERFAEFHAATTPIQRAQFVRAMREMSKMMDEAGIRD